MGYFLLAAVAAAGFVASFACHLMGWLGVDPPWGRSLFVLHVGIFVVWIPLVVISNRTMPRPGRGNWEPLIGELPKWARTAFYTLFIYALLNFGHFIVATRQYPKHGVPFPVELRGFSGHWMMFYGIAALGFIALGRLARKRRENELAAKRGDLSAGSKER